MPPLFKYVPSKYLEALVHRGELLFRSLSYFRNYEELQVRGDRNEGKRLYNPSTGLELTKTDTGEKIVLPWSFVSSVKERDIFVFCMSFERKPELAKEFGTDTCVEILDPVSLLAKIRASLALRKWVKRARLLNGAVDYYSPTEPPLAEWAVPERMIFRKTTEYAHQLDYRIAFARGDALKVDNVETKITANPGEIDPALEGHPEHTLRLGSLARICRIHTVA